MLIRIIFKRRNTYMTNLNSVDGEEPSKQFIDAFGRPRALLRIYGHLFDAFGRFDTESIYSTLLRHFWALQF